MEKPGEFEIIEKYFAPLSGRGSFALKDDAAELVPASGNSIVITQDAISENVHFFGDDPPQLIARKALRTNLSDLAAKGAKPLCFSLALGLGIGWDETWVSEFARGLAEDCDQYDILLSGGDTFQTGAGFVISICAIGETSTGSYVSRLGAKAGDLLYVTGSIGDGALGLLARQGRLSGLDPDQIGNLKSRYLLPEPRVEMSGLLRKYATAAMDVSDGFVGDVEKLMAASGVAVNMKASDIPFSNAVQAAIRLESKFLDTAITGGDDYEILFSVKPANKARLEEAAAGLPFPVTQISVIETGNSTTVFDNDGVVMEFGSTSYNHSDT